MEISVSGSVIVMHFAPYSVTSCSSMGTQVKASSWKANAVVQVAPVGV